MRSSLQQEGHSVPSHPASVTLVLYALSVGEVLYSGCAVYGFTDPNRLLGLYEGTTARATLFIDDVCNSQGWIDYWLQ